MTKTLRLNRDIGLREFCRQLSIDASNWSKVERGILPPPQGDEKLDQIAEVLGIKKTSELYNELKDKAAIDAGIIPKDLLSDQETLNSLPMFFRTIRSEKSSLTALQTSKSSSCAPLNSRSYARPTSSRSFLRIDFA